MRFGRIHGSYFSKWFEPSGDGYLYRYKGTGPAYLVTPVEHGDFVAMYARAAQRASIYLVAIMVIGSFLTALGQIMVYRAISVPFTWFGVLLFIAIGTAVYVSVLRGATREIDARLAPRPPISAALTKAEKADWQLSQISYKNLAMVPFGSLVLLFPRKHTYDPMHGWGRLVWLFVIGFNLFALFQAYRKYQSTRSNRR